MAKGSQRLQRSYVRHSFSWIVRDPILPLFSLVYVLSVPNLPKFCRNSPFSRTSVRGDRSELEMQRINAIDEAPADPSYRDLCSLETLRSGKNGFFREFSENVTRVAGERWICQVFGRLTSDEQRIRAIFTDAKVKDTVLETLNRTEILYRGKDANVSRARRLEGFEAAAAAQRRKALLLFGQAVLRAPLPGLFLSVRVGSRRSIHRSIVRSASFLSRLFSPLSRFRKMPHGRSRSRTTARVPSQSRNVSCLQRARARPS